MRYRTGRHTQRSELEPDTGVGQLAKTELCFNRYRELMVTFVALSFLAAATPVLAADYAPINCSKTALPMERAICRNYALGQAEARMATLFGVIRSLVAMGQHSDVADAQRKWLKERSACESDTPCLTRAYQSRIKALSRTLDTIAAHGPF